VKLTAPAPVPAGFEVIVIHGAFDAAVQAQPFSVLTLTVREPPDGSIACVGGVTSNAHPGDWVTV
jgi:hypothetical protein